MLLGPIQVLDKLGEGGLAVVKRCRTADGRYFAGKFLKSQSASSQTMLDDEARRHQRHQGPHVVPFLGRITLDDGTQGLAFELMEGDLARLGRLSASKTLEYLGQIVSAVAGVHASAFGAAHGDLKRQNILTTGPIAKLNDFGLARGGPGQTTMFGPHSGGTPGYMPPEGFTSQAGDIYSLGAVFFASLSGREPMANEVLVIKDTGCPLVENAVNRMLSRERYNRPTAFQVQQQLVFLKTEASKVVVQGEDPLWSFVKFAACVAGVVAVANAIGQE